MLLHREQEELEELQELYRWLVVDMPYRALTGMVMSS